MERIIMAIGNRIRKLLSLLVHLVALLLFSFALATEGHTDCHEDRSVPPSLTLFSILPSRVSTGLSPPTDGLRSFGGPPDPTLLMRKSERERISFRKRARCCPEVGT